MLEQAEGSPKPETDDASDVSAAEGAGQPPSSEAPGQPPTEPPSGAGAADRPGGKRIPGGVALGVVVVLLLLGALGSWVGYANTDLPAPLALSQTTSVQYSNGATFATLGTKNATAVKLSDVPKHVQDAVVAAEDPDFWHGNSTALGATGRAIWALVTGGQTTSGSIVQQYVRNSYDLGHGRSGRAKATIVAHKLSNSLSKQEILQAYLNSVYFGRSAWGVQAAAKAYFNKDVESLTVGEGAVLAALLTDPTKLDPSQHLPSAKNRWGDVLDSMVRTGSLSRAQRKAQTYPTFLAVAPNRDAWKAGSTGVLGHRIEQELLKLGFRERDLKTGGLIVKTTVSDAAQAAAAKAARSGVKGQDPRMATAMVSVDPTSGAVKAYYGGEAGYGSLDLAATGAAHPAAASYGPYVLAAAITDGYGIDSLWNGTSGQTFADLRPPLENFARDSSCGVRCSLTAATVKSLDTVYWAMTDAVGFDTTAKTAQAAGIKSLDGTRVSTKIKQGINAGVGLGRYSVSVLDQAAGYATMANYGKSQEPYFISQVLDSDGKTVLWDHADHTAPSSKAWSSNVGRDLSYVLEQVYNANPSVKIGRPAAIKPGSQPYQNTIQTSDAWMAGYTPQLATAVWVGSGTGTSFPLRDKVHGNVNVYGAGLPGSIWRDYMVAALKDQPRLGFRSPLHVGSRTGNAPR